MLRRRGDTQIRLNIKSSLQTGKQPRQAEIDLKIVDQNNADQALAVIVSAPECKPTFISTELVTSIITQLEFQKSVC